ncbi:MAG: hypothetical protein ACRDY2_13080 [Acidimicrobiales bacterium]
MKRPVCQGDSLPLSDGGSGADVKVRVTGTSLSPTPWGNKLIYALSAATLVECEQGSGGTWAGAVEALRGHTAPVLAWAGADAPPGNRALVRRGASPLEEVDRLFPLPAPDAQPTSTQLVLDL